MRHDSFIFHSFLLIAATACAVATLNSGNATAVRRTQSHLPSNLRMRDAREIYKMRTTNDVVLYLSGSTPIKNWKMKAHGLQGEAQISLAGSNQLSSIDNLTFHLPVHNLKGEVQAMDEDCYHALKADQFSEITFTLQSAKVLPEGNHQGEQLYLVQALGKLSVAGVTRLVTLSMHSALASDGSVKFEGAQHIKMSDYNVERPSLLFGAIKADDEMTLSYRLIFSK